MRRPRSHGGTLLPLLAFLLLVTGITSAAFHYLERRWVDFRRAEKAMAAGDFARAAELYEVARARGLDDVRVHLGLGDAAMRAQQFDRARPSFERALQLDPKSLPAIQNLAGIYQHQRQPEKAVALFEAYLRGGGELSVFARLHLARLYRETRRWPQAEPLYRALPESLPQRADAQRELAEMLAWQQRYDESIPMLQDLVRARPEDRAARLELARVLSWAGRLAESQAEYRRALE